MSHIKLLVHFSYLLEKKEKRAKNIIDLDLANPKTNTKRAGFTQEERDGMTALLEAGFVDTFRHLYPDKIGAYTFWTYFGKARLRNVGW